MQHPRFLGQWDRCCFQKTLPRCISSLSRNLYRERNRSARDLSPHLSWRKRHCVLVHKQEIWKSSRPTRDDPKEHCKRRAGSSKAIVRFRQASLRVVSTSILLSNSLSKMFGFYHSRINAGAFGVPWEKTVAILDDLGFSMTVYEIFPMKK